MKLSEDGVNDDDGDASHSDIKVDEVGATLDELNSGVEAGGENLDGEVGSNKKEEDSSGIEPPAGDGCEFEDADEGISLPQSAVSKRDRPTESDRQTDEADDGPAPSRQRLEDDPKQPVPNMPLPAQPVTETLGAADLQLAQNSNGINTQLGFDPTSLPSRTAPNQASVAGGNPLFGQANSLRDMQLAQLGMGGLPENAMMSQHLLNQQLMMGGQGQLPLGFAGNPAGLGQFGMTPFNGQFPGGAPQGGFPAQGATGAPGQEGGQPLADQNASNSTNQGGGTNGPMSGMAPVPGGPGGQMGFGNFGGRAGLLPVMGFGGMPPGMPDAAFQQMMYQRGGLTEADAMRQRMMLAGIPSGPGGFRPSFLAAAGGRLNNMSAELRGLANLQPQTPAVSLALACDDEHLSEYQIMVRKQLEVFEAQPEDVESNTQGRKKQVSLGQVGIRCKHCASLPLRQRGRGAVYYPAKLQGVYQAAQNMASSHLCESCQCIDEPLKSELKTLRERRDTASGGKQYWADGARALGLFEAEDGLRLNKEQQQQ